MSNIKNTYYAKLSKSLKKYNLSIQDFKNNPIEYFVRDNLFRQHVYSKFNPVQRYTWYNKPFRWVDHIPKTFYNQIENENFNWYITLTSFDSNNPDYDEDDLSLTDTTNENEEPPTKKSKDDNNNAETTNTSSSSMSTTSNKQKSTDPISTKSTTDTSGIKRPAEEENGSDPKQPKTDQTTNLATKIIPGSSATSPQSNPTGKGEVDQSAKQQLQTNTGNAPNQRGTVQGEAGNLKIQKPLERYGISKVIRNNMTFNDKRNKTVFVFVLECKELANDLIELMDETYKDTIIYGYTITHNDEKVLDLLHNHKYVVTWNLPFNVGFARLGEKLGTRYNKAIVFSNNYNDLDMNNEEDVIKATQNSIIVRFKNHTQISNFAEMITECNERQLQKKEYEHKPLRKKPRFE